MMSRLGINNVRELILVRGSSKLPLSINGDWTSVNDVGDLRSDTSDLGESSGASGDLPRAATKVNRSSKNPQVSGGRSAVFRRPWWSWLVGK